MTRGIAMDSLVRPLVSNKYEVAREITTNLLNKGLISPLEFELIDKENLKSFAQDTCQ
ncbi:MAG: SHOCT domain-containing protein [Bacteroidales bacterium]